MILNCVCPNNEFTCRRLGIDEFVEFDEFDAVGLGGGSPKM